MGHKKTRQELDASVHDNLLFIHAFLGCDTVSRIHGVGKGLILHKMDNTSLLNCVQVFQDAISEINDIIQAGKPAMSIICGGVEGESLDTLRYRKFCAKSATGKAAIQITSLPPTLGATKFQSLRAYFQIQEWQDTFSILKS